MGVMSLDDYQGPTGTNYRQGCGGAFDSRRHGLMTPREDALAELTAVFQLIAEEYAERNQPLPVDTTEIVHA